MEIDCPLTVASPGMLMGSGLATLTSTRVCKDQNHGCHLPVHIDDLHGADEFGGPPTAVGHQGLTLKELTNADLADGCPK